MERNSWTLVIMLADEVTQQSKLGRELFFAFLHIPLAENHSSYVKYRWGFLMRSCSLARVASFLIPSLNVLCPQLYGFSAQYFQEATVGAFELVIVLPHELVGLLSPNMPRGQVVMVHQYVWGFWSSLFSSTSRVLDLKDAPNPFLDLYLISKIS